MKGLPKGNPRDMSQYREQAKASRLAKQEATKSLKQDFNSADAEIRCYVQSRIRYLK